MHPIERLRHLARSSGADQRVLVAEAAAALRSLGNDPAGLVVSCRRITERHPSSGPLHWLCAHLLTATEPAQVARELSTRIGLDATADHLVDAVPEGATVCLVGWPDLAGEAVLRRGDVSVLVIDADGEGSALVRRLERADVAAEVVDAGAMAAAVLASDVVMVEALAASSTDLVATRGSRAVAAVAYTAEVPLWAVVGVGRSLPTEAVDSMWDRITDVRAPWLAECDLVPLALASHVAGEHGLVPLAEAVLAPECPPVPELLRPRTG